MKHFNKRLPLYIFLLVLFNCTLSLKIKVAETLQVGFFPSLKASELYLDINPKDPNEVDPPKSIPYNKIILMGKYGLLIDQEQYDTFVYDLKIKVKDKKVSKITEYRLADPTVQDGDLKIKYMIYEENDSTLKALKLEIPKQNDFEKKFLDKYVKFFLLNKDTILNQDYQTQFPFETLVFTEENNYKEGIKTDSSVLMNGILFEGQELETNDVPYLKFLTCHPLTLSEIGLQENNVNLNNNLCFGLILKWDEADDYEKDIICANSKFDPNDLNENNKNEDLSRVTKMIMETRVYQNCNRMGIKSIQTSIEEDGHVNPTKTADKTRISYTLNEFFFSKDFQNYYKTNSKMLSIINSLNDPKKKPRISKDFCDLIQSLDCKQKTDAFLKCEYDQCKNINATTANLENDAFSEKEKKEEEKKKKIEELNKNSQPNPEVLEKVEEANKGLEDINKIIEEENKKKLEKDLENIKKEEEKKKKDEELQSLKKEEAKKLEELKKSGASEEEIKEKEEEIKKINNAIEKVNNDQILFNTKDKNKNETTPSTPEEIMKEVNEILAAPTVNAGEENLVSEQVTPNETQIVNQTIPQNATQIVENPITGEKIEVPATQIVENPLTGEKIEVPATQVVENPVTGEVEVKPVTQIVENPVTGEKIEVPATQIIENPVTGEKIEVPTTQIVENPVTGEAEVKPVTQIVENLPSPQVQNTKKEDILPSITQSSTIQPINQQKANLPISQEVKPSEPIKQQPTIISEATPNLPTTEQKLPETNSETPTEEPILDEDIKIDEIKKPEIKQNLPQTEESETEEIALNEEEPQLSTEEIQLSYKPKKPKKPKNAKPSEMLKKGSRNYFDFGNLKN